MRKINRLLDTLRDEDGVINPTAYRLTDGGRSLVYHANQASKLPIQFVVEHLPLTQRASIVFPHKRLDNLSGIEFEHVFQTIMASPYRSRCEVEDTYDRTTRTSTVTIRESQDVMTSIQHDRLCAGEWLSIGFKHTVDLLPGGVHWKQRGEALMAKREQKRRVRQLRRIGLVAHLRALGIGTWGFGLDFEHHIQANTYTIKVQNCGPSRCTSTAERSKLYEGDDRTLFLRSLRGCDNKLPCPSDRS